MMFRFGHMWSASVGFLKSELRNEEQPMKAGGFKMMLLCTGITGAFVLLVLFFFGPLRQASNPSPGIRGRSAAPVEVAPIERGPITDKRVFSGELEALAEFAVAPKVSGRVESVFVDLADTVVRGQVVAALDNDEYVQAVTQAEADLVMARAKRAEATSALEIAEREFRRVESLLEDRIATDAQFDATRLNRLAREAQLKVAKAEVTKAEALLATARTRLGYTQVAADWTGGDKQRVVAERYINEGQTVAANTPLLLIVDLDPIVGIFFVTERDYAHLVPGQTVTLTTEAYPGEQFAGHIERIAPVFLQATRQARIEIVVANPGRRLRPGMFIRATVVLARLPEATIVPEQALTTRDNRPGVFVLNTDGRTVAWREVAPGIREGSRVQITGEGLTGRVVVLGQQLIRDGSPVTLPEESLPGGSAASGTETQ
jgi:RND family efflux transporter MFP subunit